jgi:hypothetical protein
LQGHLIAQVLLLPNLLLLSFVWTFASSMRAIDSGSTEDNKATVRRYFEEVLNQ